MAGRGSRVNQCQKPTGLFGRFVLRSMNSRHSGVTDWGLSQASMQASIGKEDIILDVGCGGGRTVSKLAAIATEGKVYGIDHSPESVAMAVRTNKQWIDIACVEIREASVSRLPFPDGTFDVVTAVETHFWWPALATDMREVLRVLKPGGRLILVAEVYRGSSAFSSKAVEMYSKKTGMALLSVEEHRDLFAEAGYSDFQVYTEPGKGWICCIGSRAQAS
jgi:ubiquinone/menaquinone biosynthesis C-methylase UbiE